MTSKQEKYLVIFTRNDTGKDVRIQTPVKSASLKDLFPGAGYKIQVNTSVISSIRQTSSLSR